jgi:predicted membrane protein
MKTFGEKRILLGLLLLLSGLVMLVHYYNLAPWDLPGWVISWKSLLLLIGLVLLITERNKTGGLILIIVGGIFIAGDIMGMRFWEVVRLAAPLLLIVAGVVILFRRESFSRRQINIPEGAGENDFINEMNVFGGSEKKIRTENFRGGQITAIFGGSDLDMRYSSLAPGVNAIDMLCIFGGTSIRVPEDWEVKIEVTSIFGGFSDERMIEKRPASDKTAKILYLKGLVVFGGGEIK